MKKKWMIAVPIAAVIALALILIIVDSAKKTSNTDHSADSAPTVSLSDSDVKDVTGETEHALITLSGSTGTISDETRGTSGNEVTITSKGIYRVTGSSDGVSIVIDDSTESGTVYLILDNVTMANDATALIHVTAADKTVIQLVGENVLTLTAKSASDSVDGAIFSKDDLTINGSGSLHVNSTLHGIVGKDEVRLTGGTISVQCSGRGIEVNDALLVTDGTHTVEARDDAIHSEGSVTVNGGSVTLSTNDDGIHADGVLSILGGTVAVLKSYEGFEAETVAVYGGTVSVTSSDDGINAAGGSDTSSTEKTPWSSSASTGTITISGGDVYVSAQGDGVDSNGSIYVTGGVLIVEGPTAAGNGSLDVGDGANCVASITGGTVLAIGSAGMAVNFSAGTQCSGLVSLSGDAGTTITVSDGFSFTTSKSFQTVVYSAPTMTKGNTYTITAGSASTTMDFTSDLYYSEIQGRRF
ncbi:MAG: carbohydrate-binding domain-containing protein [Lachnospiraceae bacterium]|nr:carbohydrate-binding domain-containing protein [Lachnospiraceae bacterium]